MSDYFAALLRASGLGQTPATAASTGSELSVLELEIPPFAAPLGHAPQAPAVPTQTPPAEPNATVQAAVTARQPAPKQASVTDSPRRDQVTAVLPLAEPGSAAAVTASSEPEVAHQALVQSVMRWVAGDQPAQSAAAAQQLSSSVATPALPGERLLTQAHQPAARSVATATLSNVESVAAAPRAQQQLPAQATSVLPDVLHESSTTPQPAAALRQQPEPEQSAATPADGLSISIGAIHLRVEAPATPSAPQAAAKPAVQPAAARTTNTPPATTRSSLSRRALRRI